MPMRLTNLNLPLTPPLNELVGVPGLGSKKAAARSLLIPLSILVSLSAPGVIAPGVVSPGTIPSGVKAPGVIAPGVAAPGVVAPGNVLARLSAL